MNSRTWRPAALAVAILFSAAHARAQYYNVDYQTLPNGPIQLQDEMTSYTGGILTLSGNAVNLSGQTYSNVDYVNEWVFDAYPSAYGYQGSGLWLSPGDGFTWQVTDASGSLLVSQVSPEPYSWISSYFPSAGPAVVSPSDSLPFISIGPLGPYASVPFSETIAEPIGASGWDLISSFVSTTPVPEPSTFVLLGMAAIGSMMFVGRRHRLRALSCGAG